MRGMSVVNQIKQRYLDAGLSIVHEIKLRLDESEARNFYREHEGMFYFEGLVLSMISGPCIVFVLRGEQAVKVVRALNGATDPAKAKPGTIRYDFRSAGGPFNTVHGSDSATASAHEARIILDAQARVVVVLDSLWK